MISYPPINADEQNDERRYFLFIICVHLWMLSAFICGFSFLSVFGIDRPHGGDVPFQLVAHGEQFLFGVIHLLAVLGVVIDEPCLDDGVDRAGFLAEPAEDTFAEVDIVAGRAPGTVGARF